MEGGKGEKNIEI